MNGDEVTGPLRAPGLAATYRSMVGACRPTRRLSEVLSPATVQASLREHDVVVVPNPFRRSQ